MKPTKRAKPDEATAPDWGPEAQAARRRVRAVADPDAPNATILRAESVSVCDVLYDRQLLSRDELAVAQQIAIDVEIIESTRSSANITGTGRDACGTDLIPQHSRLLAAGRLRDIRDALGTDNTAFLIDVCARNIWPAQHEQRNLKRLRALLSGLAQTWGWCYDA